MLCPPAGPWSVLRGHPGRLDAVLGLLVAVFGTVSLWSAPRLTTFPFREPDALGIGLCVLAGAAVAARTRWPVPALVASCAAALVPLYLGYPQGVSTFAPLLVLYTVASRRPVSVSGPAAALLYLLVALLLVVGPVTPTVSDWVSNTFAILAVWALGRSVRSRRAESLGREERNLALVEARAAQARATEIDERAAIAREMHVLLTHGITELTVQSAAARRVLRSDPDTAEQLLADVEAKGHHAVAELRRVLGLLRPAEDLAQLRPQPGLDELDALVASARAEGMDVRLSCTGDPVEVDQGVSLTAYRVVQEALRNTRQHAGRAAATVALAWSPDSLRLAVEDDGRGSAAWDADDPPGGYGLRSLRERVEAYGGMIRTGPRSGGGFAVTASLPTTARSSS